MSMVTDSDTRLDCGGQGHTPGPWSYVIHDYSMASLGVLPDPGMGDPLVCTFSPCKACADRADPKVWEWGRCQTPSEADARLIATAPELLTQLEYAVKLLGAFPALNGTAQVQSMRDTIAKARGQSPLPLDPSLSNKDEGGAS